MLYQRKNSRFWWCSFQVNGKRRWFSTGTESKDDALVIASSIKARLLGGSQDRFEKIIGAFAEDKAEAGMPLALLPSEYPKLAKQEGRSVSEKDMRDRVSRLSRLCSFFVGRATLASHISPAFAWEFISSLTCSVKSKRNVAGHLSSIWQTLIKFGFVSSNPWKDARPQRRAEEEKHGRAFTFEEVDALLDKAPLWIRSEILIGIYTGLRPHDIRALTWDNIDFVAGVIRVRPSKTSRFGIVVTVPIHGVLLVHLNSLSNKKGKVVKVSAHPDRDWKTLLDACNIKAEQGERITSHCLRHTFATWAAMGGASKDELMRLGGWSVDKTVDVYNHHEDVASLATVIDRIGYSPSLI